MSVILGFIATATGKWIVGILGVVVALVVANVKGRLSGAKAERDKQAADNAKARDIADEVQNDVGAIPADAARKELSTWDM